MTISDIHFIFICQDSAVSMISWLQTRLPRNCLSIPHSDQRYFPPSPIQRSVQHDPDLLEGVERPGRKCDLLFPVLPRLRMTGTMPHSPLRFHVHKKELYS